VRLRRKLRSNASLIANCATATSRAPKRSEPTQSNDRRDNGGELNGEPNERNDGTGLPVSDFKVYNATLIGSGAGAGDPANNNAFLLRRYTRTWWYNGGTTRV